MLPLRVQTSRLVLRCREREEAPALQGLIARNLDHLRAWMPWAMDEPSPLDVIEERLTLFSANFREGSDWTFGVFLADGKADGEAAIGGAGLHTRIGPGALEIGYWIDRMHLRRGYATEAAAALTQLAFSMSDIERVEIRCDPRNVPSAGIPRKLGYIHTTTLEKNTTTPTGEPRDTAVWEMMRNRFEHEHARLTRFV